jgi:tetratricopeptide (TPR) repeat protein
MGYTSLQLAESFLNAGELTDALEILDQHLQSQPDDDQARRLRAAINARLPGADALNTALADLDALRVTTAPDVGLQAILLERLGQVEEAAAVCERGCAAYPDDERLLEQWLRLLQNLGAIDRARELVAVQGQQRESWRWWQWAGDLAAEAGDDPAAAGHYTAALTMLRERHDVQPANIHTQPDTAAVLYARLLLARGGAWLRLDHNAAAEADYREAALILPDDPVIGFNRGLLAARRGDLDMARRLCEQALAAAGPALTAHLRTAVNDDPRYAPLRSWLD